MDQNRIPSYTGPMPFPDPESVTISMPTLEDMNQGNEVSRLQTELSQVERQLNNLELEMAELMKTESSIGSPRHKERRPGQRLLPQIPKGRRGDTGLMPSELVSNVNNGTYVQSNSQDQIGSLQNYIQQPVNPQPLSSTPKADAALIPDITPIKPNNEKTDKNELKRPLGVKIKPATFDGSGNWLDYKAHFEVCAQLNGWSNEEKGMYLAVSLRGQAQGVFGNITNKSHEYSELVKALEERFAPPNQTELYRVQLRKRRQKASETLSELGQDIRRLTNLAYPTAPSDLRETLAKEQFIDALINSDMRLRLSRLDQRT